MKGESTVTSRMTHDSRGVAGMRDRTVRFDSDRRRTRVIECVAMWNAILSAALATSAADVRVVVDMDAGTSGIQSHVVAPANQTRVEGIAVYAHDLTGGHTLWGIGYIGGLDRGIAFGHTPSNLNQGTVVALVPTAGATLNPGNAAELLTPAHQPGFDASRSPVPRVRRPGAVAVSRHARSADVHRRRGARERAARQHLRLLPARHGDGVVGRNTRRV